MKKRRGRPDSVEGSGVFPSLSSKTRWFEEQPACRWHFPVLFMKQGGNKGSVTLILSFTRNQEALSGRQPEAGWRHRGNPRAVGRQGADALPSSSMPQFRWSASLV